jgi:ParB family chromosome partitioning protein
MNSLKSIKNLADLMGDLPTTGPTTVPIAQVYPDPDQPRREFDIERLAALSESITAQGVIEPLIVTVHPTIPNAYMIVAGERRWRAAGSAGLVDVPIVIREFTDEQRLAVQLIENIDREELTVLEEAAAVARIIGYGKRPRDISELLGKSAAWVSLRTKIAANMQLLAGVVRDGMTKDPETLAMLVDLHKLNAEAYAAVVADGHVTRRMVKGALDLARRPNVTPEPPKATPAPASVPRPRDQAPDNEPPAEGRATGRASQPAPQTPEPRDDDQLSAQYELARMAIQQSLGLNVTIQTTGNSGAGELRIRFRDRSDLEAIRRTLA